MTPELRGPRRYNPREWYATTQARAHDRLAAAIAARVLPLLAQEYQIDRAHIRRRHIHGAKISPRLWGRGQADALPSRERWARWTVMYVMHEADLPMAAIGRALGTDHATVRNAIARMGDTPEHVQAYADQLVDLFARTGRVAS